MKTSIKKIFRDLSIYKGRTMLTLVGILIGIASVGSVVSAYSILNREMKSNFMDTNPASIVFNIANLDDKAGQLIKNAYSNVDLEFTKNVQARISRGDGTYGIIMLRAVQDFNNQKVDTFTLEKGHFPVTVSEMAIERDCINILSNIGEGVDRNISIKLPGGIEKNMNLSARVHAPGLAPASMENYSYGFLSLDGLKSLGYKGWYDELHIVSYTDRFNREKMKSLSHDISKMLAKNGYIINRIVVPIPGRHPHADQLNSLLFLLQAFAVISLLAACIIVINLINFIMSRQTRQIAIMKAVGASTFEIAKPYMFYVVLISTAGILLSIPLSIAGACGYSVFAAHILNFNINNYSIPLWAFAVQVTIGILVPLLATLYPILKSCSRSVREGLFENNSKVKIGKKSSSRKLLFTNTKFIMPINNLFRKRLRTALAILALLTGGILYMTSQNLVASINKTVDKTFTNFHWDYDISLAGTYPESKIDNILKNINGLNSFEIWKGNTVSIKKNDNTDSDYFNIKIIPENSKMINPSVTNNLYDNETGNAIVVNNGLLKEEKWIKTGMTIKTTINGKTCDMLVVGTVNEVPAIPYVYMSNKTFENLFGGISSQIIMASANTRDLMGQRKITKSIEKDFKAAGVELSENWNIYVLRKSFVDHLFVIVTFLKAISILAVLVGGLSIGSAIGINISERKRELGVLRAMGVKRNQMVVMVLFEVLLMGIAGWLIGAVLSYPITMIVGNYFGQIFLQANLQNAVSITGLVQWFIISITVSIATGFVPAWKASWEPLREMLSYE